MEEEMEDEVSLTTWTALDLGFFAFASVVVVALVAVALDDAEEVGSCGRLRFFPSLDRSSSSPLLFPFTFASLPGLALSALPLVLLVEAPAPPEEKMSSISLACVVAEAGFCFLAISRLFAVGDDTVMVSWRARDVKKH